MSADIEDRGLGVDGRVNELAKCWKMWEEDEERDGAENRTEGAWTDVDQSKCQWVCGVHMHQTTR